MTITNDGSDEEPKRQKAILPVLSSPSSRKRSTDTATPQVSVLVQGRFDGPIERYRIASKEVCRLASVLGWAAVVIGAGETVLGVVVFSKWRREGAWWAGLLAAFLGIVATGITADTPVGTPLVAWLLGLSLASFLTSLITLLTLDGARWLHVKDLEDCADTFSPVCEGSDCTCTVSEGVWDQCLSPLNGDCGGIISGVPTLLASSVVLLVLFLISALLLATAIKIEFLGGGVQIGGDTARPEPANEPGKASYSDPEGSVYGSNGIDSSMRHPHQQQQQSSLRESDEEEEDEEESAGEEELVGAEILEERKIEAGGGGGGGGGRAREVLTGAEPWAVGYVERLAGGGNKKRRDELNNLERGHGSSSGGSGLNVGGDVSQ
ncbi:unnamed protein product [Scytosiphon promiscuus]